LEIYYISQLIPILRTRELKGFRCVGALKFLKEKNYGHEFWRRFNSVVAGHSAAHHFVAGSIFKSLI